METLQDMLLDLSAHHNCATWSEGEAPRYPAELISEAQHLGLVDHYMSGGMASTGVVLRLNHRGRRYIGLPPLPTRWSKFVTLLRRALG